MTCASVELVTFLVKTETQPYNASCVKSLVVVTLHPSRCRAEEELLMKRSLLDLEEGGSGRRGSTSARRSFFRRRRHQQRSSREDGRELASFSDVSINNSCSGSAGTLAEDLPPTYLRVDRLNCT